MTPGLTQRLLFCQSNFCAEMLSGPLAVSIVAMRIGLAGLCSFLKEYFMKVLFINNEGGGFADHIEVEPNTSIRDLFKARMKANHPEDYLIRVNRLPVAADYVLQEGDRVSFTPTKIEGARPVLPETEVG
jgi:hypothetical protein